VTQSLRRAAQGGQVAPGADGCCGDRGRKAGTGRAPGGGGWLSDATVNPP